MTAPVLQPDIWQSHEPASVSRVRELLAIDRRSSANFAASLPFSAGDTTAGAENELQTVVIGSRGKVDLPLCIEQSNYYKNIIKRTLSGETPQRVVNAIEEYLGDNTENVWEHSWVRLPLQILSPYAREVFSNDLLSDKRQPLGARRSDADRFIFHLNGERCLRIPVSYLLKLSLADVLGAHQNMHPLLLSTGRELLTHFLNDNTSPETFSFYPVRLQGPPESNKSIAHETLQRFLLTQLLTLYANSRLKLEEQGQKVVVYFAPNPPVRQKHLNSLISDSFYRELFMSPCLSGWEQGEEKYHYMILCHQVLSRSHLNTLAKLKEAGIITRNLVVLPNISNISLANNGTHISLGSRKLTALLESRHSGFTTLDEKHLGDLVIKITEHFLPLFVGAYSASPYRLDYSDFHPEQVLGFLPHELDYTHLRMIWRRWKKRASIKIFGQPVTPFGFKSLDSFLSRLFSLGGDFIQDFRLIDYPAALLSTEQSPALDGRPGNDIRLKKDLSDLGVFDPKMSLYLLYKLRQYSSIGFSGFEGRYYSLFADLSSDMHQASMLQMLITACAFQYILSGVISHADIPDTPTSESERRQIFFGAAVGIPTFFVRRDTGNRFLLRILEKTCKLRPSHRYPGYLRVYNHEYRKALISVLRDEGAELIEALGLEKTVADLEARTHNPELTAAAKLTRGILRGAGSADPMDLSAAEFNSAAERYYRDTLRKRHFEEAFEGLHRSVTSILSGAQTEACEAANIIRSLFGFSDPAAFLTSVKSDLVSGCASESAIVKTIQLALAAIYRNSRENNNTRQEDRWHENSAAPVY